MKNEHHQFMQKALIFTIAALLISCGGGHESEEAKKLLLLPEGQLAAIDADTRDINEYMVSPYRIKLDLLQSRCSEPRIRIADFAVVGVELLGKKGVASDNSTFLDMMYAAIPSEVNRIKCAEIAAALTVLTPNG